jgi:hypothetical protein
MLLGEIIPVFSENDSKSINALCGQNAGLLKVKADGSYNYHCAIKRAKNLLFILLLLL